MSRPATTIRRKSNFTGSEVKTLISQCRRYRQELFNKVKTNRANMRKTEVWCHITDCINSRNGGVVTRTVDEVRKKWRDLLSRTKKDMMTKKNPNSVTTPNTISKFSTQIADFINLDVDQMDSNDQDENTDEMLKEGELVSDEEGSWIDPSEILITNQKEEPSEDSMYLESAKRMVAASNFLQSQQQNHAITNGGMDESDDNLALLKKQLLLKKIRKIELEQEKLIAERDKLRTETEVLLLKKAKLNLEMEVIKTDYS